MKWKGKIDDPGGALFIGIDPGIYTGVAIWSSKIKKFLMIGTASPVEVLLWFMTLPTDRAHILVEDPELISAIYRDRYDTSSMRIALKIAQDVGGNKELGRLNLAFCKKIGLNCTAVKPTMKKADKHLYLKNDIPYKINQHEADAAWLVFGR